MNEFDKLYTMDVLEYKQLSEVGELQKKKTPRFRGVFQLKVKSLFNNEFFHFARSVY